MSELNDGGPAFPTTDENTTIHAGFGMMLRDYFAAKEMTAIIAQLDGGLDYKEDDVAIMAYDMADAMLRAREPKEIV
ncbi:gp38 [Pandoraea iniqua]|uniref:hypothetical protein n=1 Tax=Pandoraea iniqua TaxID=2508288 RepID=UPI0012402BCF|nr:hypothetical protein [Pandoraea iniqua]VVE59527.1 gp38 [Pandoraea iniqua]